MTDQPHGGPPREGEADGPSHPPPGAGHDRSPDRAPDRPVEDRDPAAPEAPSPDRPADRPADRPDDRPGLAGWGGSRPPLPSYGPPASGAPRPGVSPASLPAGLTGSPAYTRPPSTDPRPQATSQPPPQQQPVAAPRPGGVPARPTPLPSAPPVARVSPTSTVVPPPSARDAARDAARGSASRQVGPARPVLRGRKARLTLKRVDPWSVFVLSLVVSLFLGVAIVVAALVLQAALTNLGVVDSINDLVAEVTSETGPGQPAPEPVLTTGRIVGIAALLAAVDVVLLTVLATLGAFLYNLCASFTGGIEVTLAERD